MAKAASPEARLEGFIAKYSPDMAAQIREVLARMRARLPGAVELVYDNYNALAVGFGSGERLSDAVFSIACYPRWVSLFFFPGVGLDDPLKLLKGTGRRTRHIVLLTPSMLDDPAVVELMMQALKTAPHPIDPKAPSRTVIKSVSAKQRPRRPEAKPA